MTKMIKIFDTTLRDGEQSPGCSMNLKEKIEMGKTIGKNEGGCNRSWFCYFFNRGTSPR